jgi:hypothetical protein
MSDTTARLALPCILPGQAQKEFYHNEALARIDMALHAAVQGQPLVEPPEIPIAGQSWIVAAAATGAWSGRDGALACWTEGGWRFVDPVPGMLVWNKAESHWLYWNAGAWSAGELRATAVFVGGQKVLGERQSAVPSPSGGTIIDLEARTAIAAVTAALKSHGLIE